MPFHLIKKQNQDNPNFSDPFVKGGETLRSKISNYLQSSKGKKLIFRLLIILIVLVFGWTIYSRYFQEEGNRTSKLAQFFTGQTKEEEQEIKETSKLDGLPYSQEVANRHPLAVMIENHPDARPHSGLDQASIVYEAIAEGGITRFMAIFGPQAPNKVGPVRSARTYYLDWAWEYDAFYSHVGGNIDALDLIPQIGIKDLDQFRYGTKAYWREPAKGKATEHTMYTDTEKLYGIAQDNDWDMKADFETLSFKTEISQDQRPAQQSITVDFSTDSYKVRWEYDPQTNQYKRFLAGLAHQDAISGQQLTAKNILVQEVAREATVTRINETGWKMTTIGSGKAKIFLDGKEIDGTWKKSSRSDRTKFYDSNNKEIEFNPGVTWYQILPPETAITVN